MSLRAKLTLHTEYKDKDEEDDTRELEVNLDASMPQRELSPPLYNAPPRTDVHTMESDSREKHLKEIFEKLKGPNRHFKVALPGMKDHQMLAHAARRGGNEKNEAMMHYNQGVLYDNINDCDNAIKSYKKFLKIVSRNKDATGVCLGFNHIGVALHLSGQYREAAEHHRKHKDAAIHLNSTRQSFRSQILALCNEGLAHREYGNLETAEACHKEALEISKEIHDKGGEALAAGQLGLDSIKLRTESRLEFGRKNLERHMDLCSATLRGEEGFDSSHSKDPRNISNAFHQLGLLANNEMMYGEAVQHFERSLALARQCGNYKESNLDKCHVGIALAKERISDFQKAIQGGASFTDATSVLKK